jgi:uncharacterized protein (DUF885 family)
MYSPEARARRKIQLPPLIAQVALHSILRCSYLIFAAIGCGGVSAQVQPAPNGDQRFSTLEHEYAVYFMSRFPVVATYLGGSAFDPALADIDAKLRDYSPPALQQEDAQFAALKQRLSALAPESLSARRRIDREVALAEINFLLHQHEVRRHQERSLDSYVDEPFRGVDWQIQGMTATGAATYGTASEWRAVIARTRAVPTYLANAQRQITAGIARKNTPDWRVLVDYGLTSAFADAEYFAHTLPALAAQDIAGSDRETLLADLASAGDAASAAYLGLRLFVIANFFDNPNAQDAAGLQAQYRADHFAFGATEYD